MRELRVEPRLTVPGLSSDFLVGVTGASGLVPSVVVLKWLPVASGCFSTAGVTAGVSGRGTAAGAGASVIDSVAGLASGNAGAVGFTGESRATASVCATYDKVINSSGSIRVPTLSSANLRLHLA